MTHARPLYPVGILAIVFAALSANAADWKATLQESLATNYELTKTGIDRVRITKAGTVLVIRKENISGDLAKDMTFLSSM